MLLAVPHMLKLDSFEISVNKNTYSYFLWKIKNCFNHLAQTG